jgi:hypothetical protein
MVNLRHLARDGLTSRFIGLNYSPLTGYNPQSRFDTSLLTVHNTLIRHLHIMRLIDSSLCRMCGAEQVPSTYVMCV